MIAYPQKSHMPFFTVVIPTYNRAELLKESIQSVLDQTFKDFELIVVDDHSTDSTKEVIESFKDERIVYILNDRGRGGAGTRNAGIFRAKGKWIAFLDDDDVWLPFKLKRQCDKIKQSDNAVGLIYTGRAVYDFSKKKEISIHVPQKEGWIQKDLFCTNYIGTFSTVAIRSEILKKIYGLDEQFASMQDIELYVRIAGISKIASVQEILSYIRHNNSDKISLNFQKKLESSLLFREKFAGQINKNPKFRHRASARVFSFAVRSGNFAHAFKSLPWTFLGLFFDFSNVFWIIRRIMSFYYRKKWKIETCF
jgi:glycosyltransferase involved in cell wall biosynthesis